MLFLTSKTLVFILHRSRKLQRNPIVHIFWLYLHFSASLDRTFQDLKLILQTGKILSRPHKCVISSRFSLFAQELYFTLGSTPHIAADEACFFTQKVLIFFLFLHKNIRCGYSLEVPCQGTSNEYPQHMFLRRNKKNILWRPLLSGCTPRMVCIECLFPVEQPQQRKVGSISDYDPMNEKYGSITGQTSQGARRSKCGTASSAGVEHK